MDILFEVILEILFDTAGDSDVNPIIRLVVNGILAVLGGGGGIFCVIYGLSEDNTGMIVVGALIGAATLILTVRNIIRIVRRGM